MSLLEVRARWLRGPSMRIECVPWSCLAALCAVLGWASTTAAKNAGSEPELPPLPKKTLRVVVAGSEPFVQGTADRPTGLSVEVFQDDGRASRRRNPVHRRAVDSRGPRSGRRRGRRCRGRPDQHHCRSRHAGAVHSTLLPRESVDRRASDRQLVLQAPSLPDDHLSRGWWRLDARAVRGGYGSLAR